VPDGLPGLGQGQQLEELVEGAEAAREDDERLRVADEHQLAREEVVEGDADVHVRIHPLLLRQQDVEPDRGRAGVASAAIGGLHDSRPAAGDHRDPRLAQHPADLAGVLVRAVARRRPRRTEDADRGPDLPEGLEPGSQLLVDQNEPLGVRAGRGHVAPLGGDDLLAE